MSSEERKTIDELLVRYEYEPTLKDIYVEGGCDLGLVEWIVEEMNLNDVVVYPIAGVNVDSLVTFRHSANDNNRERVIALGLELSRHSTVDLFHNVVCLADRDFSHLTREDVDCPLVILSDFTSVELYAFNEKALKKFLRLVVRRSDLDALDVLRSISPVLTVMFSTRLASRELGIDLAPIQFDGCCKEKTGKFTFDSVEYIRRYVQRGIYSSRYREFASRVAEIHDGLAGDIRMFVHGHDFVSVLHWYLQTVRRVPRLMKEEDLGRSLIGSLESVSVKETDMCSELLKRFA